jgi:hypothetical protein
MIPKCHGDDAARAADDSSSAPAGLDRTADDSKPLIHGSECTAIDASSSADDSRLSLFAFDPAAELFEVDIVHWETTSKFRK